jgi:hypothetical protein
LNQFNEIVLAQMERCKSLLITKGNEYAPGASEIVNIKRSDGYEKNDRLALFKKAAVVTNSTPKAALLGMLTKHLVSVSDMCTDEKEYSMEKWDEKITDSINYLLILRAMVEEEQNEKNRSKDIES